MRILYLVHQFFPSYYQGTERFILNVSRQMQKMGHDVLVLAYEMNETGDFRDDGEILSKRYRYQEIPVISVKHKNTLPQLDYLIFEDEMANFATNFLNRENFDLIHIGHPMRIGSLARAAKSKGIPIVLTLTDFWLTCHRGIAVTNEGILCDDPQEGQKCIKGCIPSNLRHLVGKDRFKGAKELLGCADVITAPTYFLANKIMKFMPNNIRVVHHGIQYASIHPIERRMDEESQVVFGFNGAVLPHKGVHTVIKALKLLKNENIKFKVYGHHFHEVAYYNSLKSAAESDKRVEFFGEYKEEELNDIMNGMDCMLVPSLWWENSPLTALTSLAYRIPVIATNKGGAAELIKDGINGFNFEMGSPEDLAAKMKRIADHPSILNELRDNIIRPPRVEDEALNYERIYRTLI